MGRNAIEAADRDLDIELTLNDLMGRLDRELSLEIAKQCNRRFKQYKVDWIAFDLEDQLVAEYAAQLEYDISWTFDWRDNVCKVAASMSLQHNVAHLAKQISAVALELNTHARKLLAKYVLTFEGRFYSDFAPMESLESFVLERLDDDLMEKKWKQHINS